MPGDDFEIVPQKDFFQMKKDVDALKNNPLGATKEGRDLKESVDNLNRTMKDMLELFSTALESIKIDEHDRKLVEDKIEPLANKIDDLSKQNEKIAKALVAIAEMVKDIKAPSQPQPLNQTSQNPQPNFPQRPFDMPPSDFGQPMPQMQGSIPMPRGFEPIPGNPPPPGMGEKKKLFGFK